MRGSAKSVKAQHGMKRVSMLSRSTLRPRLRPTEQNKAPEHRRHRTYTGPEKNLHCYLDARLSKTPLLCTDNQNLPCGYISLSQTMRTKNKRNS